MQERMKIHHPFKGTGIECAMCGMPDENHQQFIQCDECGMIYDAHKEHSHATK